MKRWLAAMMALVLLLALLPVGSVAAEYATIKGGWLRLRSYPSYDSQTLASYYTGTVVELLGTSGVWYHVRLSDGNTGYMHGDYLTKGASAPDDSGSANGSTQSGANVRVVSSNGYGVRLRVGPGTNYRVIRKFPVGTPATILKSGSYWCKISIGGYTGYMMSQFLSVSGNDASDGGTVTYVGDATIWSGNGYGVRLRTGPGKQYSKIGVYSVGTKVKIISKGDVWDYIQVGSRRGYMMNEFLLYNSHYTVTDVTINNLKPVVGNVLAVKSVTPSTATVTYEWLVTPEGGKETVKGTTAAYMVTDADIGATIRLRVTGTDSYKGTAISAATEKVVRTGTVENLTLNTMCPYVGDVLKATVYPAGATVEYHWSVDGVEKSTAATYTVQPEDAGKQVSLQVVGKYPFSGSCSVTTSPVLAMNAPVIDTAALPNGKYHSDYSHQLIAYGGGEHSWSIIKGALPEGLTLSKDGLISGTPTQCGTATFTVQVSNSMGKTTQEMQLTIDKARVTIAAIEGVAIPAKDETAPVQIQSTDQYTGAIRWKPELTNGAFAASTAYTADISLTAKPEYTFTGLTSSFFTVSGATGVSCTIGSDGSTATVTAVFPATAANTAVKLAKPVISGIAKQGDDWVISWSAVENASGYMLRIGNQTWLRCETNSYTLTDAPESGTYQVFAVGDGVNYSDSDPSDYVFTMPVAIPLNAPANIKITSDGESWVISWDAVANAIGYRLRKAGGEWWAVPGTSYTFSAQPENNDQFEVIAAGDGTYYADSEAATYTYTASAVKLPMPQNLTIQEKDGVWTAGWQSVENASGYRFGDTLGNWYACSMNVFTFAGTPADGVYSVYAVGNGITYTDSDIAQLTYQSEQPPAPVKLAAPAGLKISRQEDAWVASWGSVENATGYRFSDNSRSVIPCEDTSYTFAGEPADGVYSVYAVGDGIRFVDSDQTTLNYAGEQQPGQEEQPEQPEEPAVQQLPAPANLTIREENGVWTATWDLVDDATGYRFRKNDGAWVDCAFGSYTFINPPETAEYSVVAVGDGTARTDSEAAVISYTSAVVVPEQLSAPANLSIKLEDEGWTAKWDAVENATGYFFRKAGDEWQACANASYLFTDPPVSADYTVYAAADGTTYRDSAISTISFTAPGQRQEAEKLPVPELLTIEEEEGVWVARWNMVENAEGYRFRKNEGEWQDCTEAFYLFTAAPEAADYSVIAVGDGTRYTDSDAAILAYTGDETEGPVDPEGTEDPAVEGEEGNTDDPVAEDTTLNEGDTATDDESFVEGVEMAAEADESAGQEPEEAPAADESSAAEEAPVADEALEDEQEASGDIL